MILICFHQTIYFICNLDKLLNATDLNTHQQNNASMQRDAQTESHRDK